ncbi:MAG: phenylalanine--tRNA ligase beta subunit-related protein [Alphaproteobacteria bacterium]
MSTIVPIRFSVTPEVTALGVKVACFAVYGLDNAAYGPAFESFRKSRLGELKSKWERATYAEDPILKGFRQLHEKIGKTGKRWTSSPENLRRLLLELEDFPKINPVVDIYNVVSLETGLALGAHDIASIAGGVTLRLTTGSEKFWPIGAKETEKVSAGEYAYCDDDNEVICRMEVRQVEKTKVTHESKDIFFIVQGHDGMPEAAIRQTAENLAGMITSDLGGRPVYL